MGEFFAYFTQLLPQMVDGLWVTVGLFVLTLLFSIPLGVGAARLRMSRSKVVSGIMGAYIWVFRGTPLTLQLVFIYFGLPRLGIQLDRFPTAILAFSINYAAYFAEIFRGAIQSIERGQLEAADVLGMTRAQTMMRIILPQAFKRALPTLGNEAVSLVKDSALVYVISLADLLRVVTVTAIRDITVVPFFVATLFYLLMTFIVERLVAAAEKRFAYYE